MSVNEVLKQALELKADDRFKIVDEILKSLDKLDEEIDEIWTNESISRLEAYRKGSLETVSEEDFFNYKYAN
ncbi:MAG: addiction module protein [Campylobacterota bacterium]|nr:addiction module protein [Campylobacterota bacterium]